MVGRERLLPIHVEAGDGQRTVVEGVEERLLVN